MQTFSELVLQQRGAVTAGQSGWVRPGDKESLTCGISPRFVAVCGSRELHLQPKRCCPIVTTKDCDGELKDKSVSELS